MDRLSQQLINAARYNDLLKVEELLSSGVDINSVDNVGMSALMVASYFGNLIIARYLLKDGANPNIRDKWGNTALLYSSSRYGTIYIVEELLKYGKVNPLLKNNKGESAYDNAISNNQIEIAELLKYYMNIYNLQNRRRRNLTHRRMRTEEATRNLAMSRIFEYHDVDDPLTRILRRETLRSIYG